MDILDCQEGKEAMSLAHAILGLLADEPMTGYDLKTIAFDRSVNHFWSADQAQIYRTLDKLAEQGFVEYTLEIQPDGPNRKVYRPTNAGMVELRRWLAAPQPVPTRRDPGLIQLFFGEYIEEAQLVAVLEQKLAEHRARLALYKAIAAKPPMSEPPASRKQLLHRLTLDCGLSTEQAAIDWLETTLQRVRE
jgi:PadR family transcriptional regulator, regulatory protein AphA